MYVKIDVGNSTHALVPADIFDSIMSDPRVEFIERKWSSEKPQHMSVLKPEFALPTVTTAQLNVIKVETRLYEEKVHKV